MKEENGRFLFEVGQLGTASVQTILAKAGFNPFQPRDFRGWWTRDGTTEGTSLRPEQIQYRGYFHDIVVDHMLSNLSSQGIKTIKNVYVFGINGVLAIPDGATLIPGRNPIFIEVKTGWDPDFTINQKQVYPLICEGGHAVSTDLRIRELGLTPGAPLPPLDILVAHTYGPGLPIRAESFCEMYRFGRKHHVP